MSRRLRRARHGARPLEGTAGATGDAVAHGAHHGGRDDDGISIRSDFGIDLAGGAISAVFDSVAAGTTHGESTDLGSIPGTVVTGAGTLPDRARVDSVTVVSDPMSGAGSDTYGASERIRFRVVFTRPVRVIGVPALRFELGNGTVSAAFANQAAPEVLEFACTVGRGDRDADGIAIPSSVLHVPAGAGIRDTAGGDALNAFATHGAHPGHNVNGSLRAPADADARLSFLELRPGVRLAPAFSRDHTICTAAVGNTTEEITVSAITVGGAAATPAFLDGANGPPRGRRPGDGAPPGGPRGRGQRRQGEGDRAGPRHHRGVHMKKVTAHPRWLFVRLRRCSGPWIPAFAGTTGNACDGSGAGPGVSGESRWIPAFAGMTGSTPDALLRHSRESGNPPAFAELVRASPGHTNRRQMRRHSREGGNPVTLLQPADDGSEQLLKKKTNRRRRTRWPTLTGAVAALALALGTTPSTAQEPVEVPRNWAAMPGVEDFDFDRPFRVLFVSSTTRNAASTDIADYNAHVQNAAAGGLAAIVPYKANFRVLGSTGRVKARDNASLNGTGMPIYWVGSTDKIANDYPDFLDGTWNAQDAGKTESGVAVTQAQWFNIGTGSRSNGSRLVVSGGRNWVLGQSRVVTGTLVGGTDSRQTALGWNGIPVRPTNAAITAFTSQNGVPFTFYGISQPFYKVLPKATRIRMMTSPEGGPRNDAYEAGNRIEIEVEFNEPVHATGTPELTFYLGANTTPAEQQQARKARYLRGSGSTQIVFVYTVQPADADVDGIMVHEEIDGAALGNGSIQANLDNHSLAVPSSNRLMVLDPALILGSTAGTRETRVESVTITSDPKGGDDSDTYGLGEYITLQLAFDAPVRVTGRPLLTAA